MRVLTVSEMKSPRRHIPHRDYPSAGSLMDTIYRRLNADPGRYIDLLDLSRANPHGHFGSAISRLQDDYGLDIRKKPHTRCGLYVLAGEWFGSHYSDYVAAAYADGSDHSPNPLHAEGIIAMSRAEDIPQDVWDAATTCYEALPLVYDGWDETEVVSCIARAIMAATAAEREACAATLENINIDFQDRFAAAAAIRKRGGR